VTDPDDRRRILREFQHDGWFAVIAHDRLSAVIAHLRFRAVISDSRIAAGSGFRPSADRDTPGGIAG
jgi:hypothetical protein